MDISARHETASGPSAASRNKAHPAEFLSFKLGSEEYGIDILKVQEIRGYEQPTRMANVPAFIKGVVNLRGIIVPIIDLRIKFNLPSVEYNDFTVVIIINVANRVIGIVVDSVSDVITLAADQIKPAPGFAASLDTAHVIGLGTLDTRMLILIDIERLMSGHDMGLMDPSQVH
jgi:purine-binding chemotaxis protein CheW